MANNKKNSVSDREIRICFAVDPELKQRLNKQVEWGDVKKIFTPITEQLVQLMEDYDPAVIQAAIVSEKLKLSQLIDLDKPKEDGE